jgi:hypothetical protein
LIHNPDRDPGMYMRYWQHPHVDFSALDRARLLPTNRLHDCIARRGSQKENRALMRPHQGKD